MKPLKNNGKIIDFLSKHKNNIKKIIYINKAKTNK